MSLPFYLQDPGPHWYDGRIPWMVLDLETTNKDHGDPRNVANRIVRVCVDGKIQNDAFPDLDGSPCVLVAHNAKFELGWLHRYHCDLSQILPWDTMIAEYVLAGNRRVELSLGATAERYGLPGKDPVVDALIKGGVCPSEIPEHWLDERVKYDVETTNQIARIQYELLKHKGLLPVFFTRCIVTPVLAAIEAEGMRLDAGRVQHEFFTQGALEEQAELGLADMTGGINMASRPQVAAYLYDTLGFDELTDRNGEPKRTPGGQRLTDADTIDRLKSTTPAQREFLKLQAAYAHASSRLSKNLQFFQGACEQNDGVILGTFNQAVTQTHRLSASGKRITTRWGDRGAQFQNLPREYKRLFRPLKDGRALCELDYSQLEFRVAVDLAKDEQGMRDIESGHDVHKFTASVLKRKPMDEVTDKERQEAKASTFKPLYGGSSGTAREKAYYEQFRLRYPQIDAMQRKWLAEVLETKQLVTASGLRYYWPDTRVQESGYVTNTPSIFNYPVQAFATADIVLIGLAHLHWRIQGTGVHIVNTVHDSVILDIPVELCERVGVGGNAREALIDDVSRYLKTVYGHELSVPLAGEYVIAPHWGDKTSAISSGTF